ncbi:MAG: hypothetical protein ABR597_13570 [Bacteroidales bacterium]
MEALIDRRNLGVIFESYSKLAQARVWAPGKSSVKLKFPKKPGYTVKTLDAITGGLAGILLGSWIFAVMYPKLKDGILKMGDFGDITISRLLKVNDWVLVVPAVALIVLLLYWIESAGF